MTNIAPDYIPRDKNVVFIKSHPSYQYATSATDYSSKKTKTHKSATEYERSLPASGKTSTRDLLHKIDEMIYNKSTSAEVEDLKEGDDMNNISWETKYLEGLEKNQSDIREDMKLSEDRISKLIEDSNRRVEGLVGEIKDNNVRLESKFDTLQREVKEDVKHNKHFSIATLLSLVAILISFIVGITQIVIAIQGLQG